jgi:serine/threonine-protein kinase
VCVKVLDFGISKMTGDPALDMTKTRDIMGSPLYMAPEQMRSSHHADARSDVWALGVILYKLVTGRLPFYAQGLFEVCSVVLERSPVRPSTLRPDLPADLEEVILRCLAKDPEGRPGSAAELAAVLAPFTERRRSVDHISVELLDVPDAPISVGARTSAEVDPIPVDLVDETDDSPDPGPRPTPERTHVRSSLSSSSGRTTLPPRSRRRGPLAAVAAVLAGLLGSLVSLAGTGAIVSQDGLPKVAPPRPPAPAVPAAAEPPREHAAATPARPRTVVPATCPIAEKKAPSASPGGAEDPFRILEPSPPQVTSKR